MLSNTLGSLNFTIGALYLNNESIILTSEESIVKEYIKEFQYLFKLYSPDQ